MTGAPFVTPVRNALVEKKADEGWTLLGAREDRRDLA
jgi:hypothetical protein